MNHPPLPNMNLFFKMGILPSINIVFSPAQGRRLTLSLNPYFKQRQYHTRCLKQVLDTSSSPQSFCCYF